MNKGEGGIARSMDRWKGRIALVTEASASIGAAICRELVNHGMTVMGCARNILKIIEIAKEEVVVKAPGKLIAWKCDMAKESDILAMYDEIRKSFGRIDVCINNAEFSTNSSLIEGETSDWRHMIELNVIGLSISTREAIKLMKEKKIDDGQIIQIGSIVGHRILPIPRLLGNRPPSWYHIYCGTKRKILALTEGLRQELKAMDSKIRVATISQGDVEPDLAAVETFKEIAEEFLATHKILQAKDVAGAVIYILSTPAYANVHDVMMEPIAYQIWNC